MTSRRLTGTGLDPRELLVTVMVYAACAASSVDPDLWFPVSRDPALARREAADALTVCTACLVRPHCLELALRHWTLGQHGVWGGTLPDERRALRSRPAAVPRPAGQVGS